MRLLHQLQVFLHPGRRFLAELLHLSIMFHRDCHQQNGHPHSRNDDNCDENLFEHAGSLMEALIRG